ncbi:MULTISPECIES: hypothetical protein [unclassified Acinetobacter]|nr:MULTISPECIES: hypothetical protein [unclassified Acinetobacter]
MKKLILLAMMLGLTGCGDNNQSDNQSNTQVNTLQKTEAAPTVANYSLAAPRAMSAVAPLQGWSITQSIVMGASTLIDAIKDTKVSAALVTPNAKQVAEVLRGGAAGVALSIAVDQLLDAVDWVMDPANNRIVYKVQPEVNPNIPRYWVISDRFINPNAYGYATPQLACNAHLGKKVWATSPIVSSVKDEGINPNNPYISGCLLYKDDGSLFGSSSVSYEINPAYDPKKQPEEEFLSLETVAEQVISNAQVGNLDAQVATNIAAQNILNDEELAKPVVQKLEDNARDKDPKCKEYVDEIVNHVSD